jgi:hypothetical protein
MRKRDGPDPACRAAVAEDRAATAAPSGSHVRRVLETLKSFATVTPEKRAARACAISSCRSSDVPAPQSQGFFRHVATPAVASPRALEIDFVLTAGGMLRCGGTGDGTTRSAR